MLEALILSTESSLSSLFDHSVERIGASDPHFSPLSALGPMLVTILVSTSVPPSKNLKVARHLCPLSALGSILAIILGAAILPPSKKRNFEMGQRPILQKKLLLKLASVSPCHKERILLGKKQGNPIDSVELKVPILATVRSPLCNTLLPPTPSPLIPRPSFRCAAVARVAFTIDASSVGW